MFRAALGNLQGGIAFVDHVLADAVDLVAEDEGQLLAAAAAEFPPELEGMDRLFDGKDRVALFLQPFDDRERVVSIFPRDAVLGAEGGLVDLGGRGRGGDAAEENLVDTEGVGAAEGGSDVVGAADIVQDDHQAALWPLGAVLLGAHAAELYVEKFPVFHTVYKDSDFYLG